VLLSEVADDFDERGEADSEADRNAGEAHPRFQVRKQGVRRSADGGRAADEAAGCALEVLHAHELD